MYTTHRRTYHWNWHILYAIVYPLQYWLRRRITNALGTWFHSLLLWPVHLARIRHHVSSQWRREGLSGGGVHEAEVPCDCHFLNERHSAWVLREWVYRMYRMGVIYLLLTCLCVTRYLQASMLASGIQLASWVSNFVIAYSLQRARLRRLGQNVASPSGVRTIISLNDVIVCQYLPF